MLALVGRSKSDMEWLRFLCPIYVAYWLKEKAEWAEALAMKHDLTLSRLEALFGRWEKKAERIGEQAHNDLRLTK